VLLERREHLIESGRGRAAGSERLLELGDETALALELGALDHGSNYRRDLVRGGVLEVGVDDLGEHVGELAAKAVLDHGAQLIRADEHELLKWAAQMRAQ
jgi:hypothetical protein